MAEHSTDQTNSLGKTTTPVLKSELTVLFLGECIQGNKMDATNLATVFAPNVLHCNKPGGKEGVEKPEDRIDVINVIRALIETNNDLFNVSAELLDEVYVHMMDSHPEALDQLMNKKSAAEE